MVDLSILSLALNTCPTLAMDSKHYRLLVVFVRYFVLISYLLNFSLFQHTKPCAPFPSQHASIAYRKILTIHSAKWLGNLLLKKLLQERMNRFHSLLLLSRCFRKTRHSFRAFGRMKSWHELKTLLWPKMRLEWKVNGYLKVLSIRRIFPFKKPCGRDRHFNRELSHFDFQTTSDRKTCLPFRRATSQSSPLWWYSSRSSAWQITTTRSFVQSASVCPLKSDDLFCLRKVFWNSSKVTHRSTVARQWCCGRRKCATRPGSPSASPTASCPSSRSCCASVGLTGLPTALRPSASYRWTYRRRTDVKWRSNAGLFPTKEKHCCDR